MKRGVYVGAGTDITPILGCPDIQEFIYIDSQPFSEFGTMTYTRETDTVTYVKSRDKIFTNALSREYFIPNLLKEMDEHKIRLIDKNKEYLTFQSERGQTIFYYFSTSFPEFVSKECKKKISQCDTMFVFGHYPHKDIFTMLKTPVRFIGNTNTVYSYDPYNDEDTCVKTILDTPHVIKDYYCLLEKKDEMEYTMHKVANIKELNEFCTEYRKLKKSFE